MRRFFSYKPRSGSRVLVAIPTAEIAICQVQAGTVAVGNMATISMYSAQPGRHCRFDAQRFAEETIRLVGGLAEDNQGVVTLCVPERYAWVVANAAADLMPELDRADLMRQLWRQGLAVLNEIDQHVGFGYAPSSHICGEPNPVEAIPGWKTTAEEETVPCLYVVSKDNIYNGSDATPVSDKGRQVTAKVDENWSMLTTGDRISPPDGDPMTPESYAERYGIPNASNVPWFFPAWAGWPVIQQ